MIDVSLHLDWLVGQITRRGGRFVQADIGALGAVAALHPRSSVAAIVNATGLGSAALALDSSLYTDLEKNTQKNMLLGHFSRRVRLYATAHAL